MTLYHPRRFERRACCWPVQGKPCGIMFDPADPRQVVCPAHSVAYRTQRQRERNRKR